MVTPTVIIAEDDFLIREGLLRSILEPHYQIVAAVDDGREAVKAAAEHLPTIVLLDISMPGLRGFEAAKQILSTQPKCTVLFVTNFADNSYADQASEMGAGGYVLKSRAHTELLPAIETALGNGFHRSKF